MQIHSHAVRVVLNGRQETAPSIRRSWPRAFWPRPEGRGSARALQFAELLERDGARLEPASDVTTGSHNTFEEMVRTHGSSHVALPVRRCSWPAPRAYLDLLRSRELRAVAGHYLKIFATHATCPQDIVLRLPNRRIYTLSHVREFLAGLDSTWEDRLTTWTLGVRNALEQARRCLLSRRRRGPSGPKTCLRQGTRCLILRRRPG